jgi:hypothetical protein
MLPEMSRGTAKLINGKDRTRPAGSLLLCFCIFRFRAKFRGIRDAEITTNKRLLSASGELPFPPVSHLYFPAPARTPGCPFSNEFDSCSVAAFPGSGVRFLCVISGVRTIKNP